jgi:PAS domain S-box-containing protein
MSQQDDLTEYSSANAYRLLVQRIKDYAIYLLRPDGVVASWNAGARRFKGYADEEIIGQHYSVFYEVADRLAGLPETNLAIALREGKFEDEGWRVRKDGSRFWGPRGDRSHLSRRWPPAGLRQDHPRPYQTAGNQRENPLHGAPRCHDRPAQPRAFPGAAR